MVACPDRRLAVPGRTGDDNQPLAALGHLGQHRRNAQTFQAADFIGQQAETGRQLAFGEENVGPEAVFIIGKRKVQLLTVGSDAV